MKPKIAVLMPDNHARQSFVNQRVMDELAKVGDVTYNNSDYNPSVLVEMIKDADICLTGWGCPKLDETILANASKLKLIAHTGGAVAAIVSPYLYERNIKIISGNEGYAESVAEGTLAYFLAGLRHIPYYNELVQKGEWKSPGFANKGLLDKKVGLIGFGAISRYLLPLLNPFRVEILVYSKHLSEED